MFGPRRPRFTVTALSSPHELLGIPLTATEALIQSAYRKKAICMHPDVDHTPGATKRFLDLRDAYEKMMHIFRTKGSAASEMKYDVFPSRRAVTRQRWMQNHTLNARTLCV